MFSDDLETKQALSALESLILSRPRPLVVWFGAGASKWAGYPLWEELADEMHGRFAREVGTYTKEAASSLLAEGAYPKVFEEMKTSDSALYFSLLTDAFAYRQPTPVYERMLRALRTIRPTYLLTTNVDESLERHLPGPETVQRSDIERLPRLLGERRAFICKVHGSVSAVETMVFSARDYDAVLDDVRFVDALHSIFAECSVLFLGYGLRDEHVIEALRRGASTHRLFGAGPHFMVVPEGSSPAREGVKHIRYRVDPADHRSAIMSLEAVANMQALRSSATSTAWNGEEQRSRESVYFMGALLPWGKHTTSQVITVESSAGTEECFVGEGYVDGEVVLDGYSALHDVVVGLICFDVTCLSIDHLGRLHNLLGSSWFWRFVEAEAIRLIAPPHEPLVMFPEPGALTGEIKAFAVGGESSTAESFKERTIAERIGRQLTAVPGKEDGAARQMERLASASIDLTQAMTSDELEQMTRSLLVNPSVRRLLGMSGGTPLDAVPRWLAYPVIRLAGVIRQGVICQHVGATATRMLLGSETLASVAFAASSGRAWADQAASYALTGRFNSDLGAVIEHQPALLGGVLRFRESNGGHSFRRELAARLATNEGGQTVAAVNAGLREAIPAAVLQQAHDELSGLFMPRISGPILRPAVWGDLRNGDERMAGWRRKSRARLDELRRVGRWNPYDPCPCGSGEKLKFCCLSALRP